MDYEDSNVSLEKEQKNHKRREHTENDDQELDKENKDHEAEAEKMINKEQLVKEVLNEGLEKIIDAEKKDIDRIKEDNAEIEKNVDRKKSLKKQRVIGSEGVESEIKETVEESDVESTTKKRKRFKGKVDKKVGNIEKTTAKKDRTKKKLRKIKQTKSYIPSTVKLNKLNREFYDERKWPDGVVRYVIKHIPEYDLEDLRNRLAQVNSILQQKTCVKLVEVDEDVAEGYDDYLVLDNSPDYVTGRVGGKQIFGCVELFQGGQHRQHTAMMVMAMLGFYFEVARHDRDQYIRVHNRHVRPDKLHHFEMIRDEATLDLPYDYQSATHPAWQFWRKIGKTGISTVATYKQNDPDGSVMRALGQNPQLLSNYDLIKINSVYGVDCFKNSRASGKQNVKHAYA